MVGALLIRLFLPFLRSRGRCACLRGPVFVDGRNLYEPDALRALSFAYDGIGRGYTPQGGPAEAGELYVEPLTSVA